MISSIPKSLGFGSGIDTPNLVNDLANASRDQKVKRLDTLSQNVQKKISALAQVRSDLDSFTSSLSSVSAQSNMRSQPTTSNPSIVTATSLAGARLGGLASEITVSQLARAQTSYSGFVTNATDPIGQGSMTLNVGGQNYAVTVDATNDSLTGLANAINATGSSVRASIITDPAGARLVLKGQTGATKSFTLVADAVASPGLTAFTTGAMTTSQTAQDAQFSVDGVAYSRSSNVIEDVIPGVSLALKQAAPTTPVSLGSQRPTDTLRTSLNDFISVFNTVRADLNQARTATSGAEAVRMLDRQLSQLNGKAVTSHPTIKSLSDIGVRSNRDGTLSLDTARFEAALLSDPDAVEAIFAPTRDSTHTLATDPGLSGAMEEIKNAITVSNGPFDALRKRFETEEKAIANDRSKMETREAMYRARLEAQFAAMDNRIGALKSTQTYLEQQIKLWTSSGG